MKISQGVLRKLILEALEEIYVPGKETDKFVDPKTGEVKATAPKTIKIPKIKNPFGEGEDNKKKFLSTFQPIINFSFNMPDFDKSPTHDLSNEDPDDALATILSSINYRRNTNRGSNSTTSVMVNKDFGSSFSPEEIGKIADAIKLVPNLVNAETVIKIYDTLGGSKLTYVPSINPNDGPKTVNMKPPGAFNEEKTKKFKIKYKCNY